MPCTPFALERWFARHEFSTRWTLSSSDCDGLSQAELLAGADAELRALWDGLRLGYTESAGHPLLRAEVAATYAGVAPDEVQAFVPEEGIYAAMRCLLEPGDRVVCTVPAYQSLYQVAADLGCEVVPWKPREAGGWRFDPDDLAALLRPATRLVVVNFPHNPTGALATRGELERIVELVRARGAWLFSDEMYRGLERDAAERLPSAVERYERAVVLSGVSKTLGLAGLRVGWLVARDAELRARLAAFKDYLTICGSAPSEILALIGLRGREAILARHRERIARNLARLEAFVAGRPATLALSPPRAGPVCFPRLTTREGATALAERAAAAGLLLVPSSVFDWGDAHLRFGLGRESFGEALERFGALL
ncbi:MAG: aminotransferase class I/II-fold pyridoxal phosphate-dependent enzyme [Deltaproteobacteria bacterium]|nr:aminotransferase class I/II-fold pyridoxal phosphate-dependent enzyme [Deltaproteobacteria bacterium]